MHANLRICLLNRINSLLTCTYIDTMYMPNEFQLFHACIFQNFTKTPWNEADAVFPLIFWGKFEIQEVRKWITEHANKNLVGPLNWESITMKITTETIKDCPSKSWYLWHDIIPIQVQCFINAIVNVVTNSINFQSWCFNAWDFTCKI